MFPHKISSPPEKEIRVLILDDQRFDRHRLARLCSGLDIKCALTNANTLADFAAIIDVAQFELVLLDYGLPDGTGFDALSMVRLSPDNCNAALIMVSGQDQENLAQEALKAGCSDYIPKDDLSPSSFRRAVTNAMQKSQLTNAVQTQSTRSAETDAVLQGFASQCAQDIKPMVSRMMRQLRDLRRKQDTNGTESSLDEVEQSCMLLWGFLVELESFKDEDKVKSHSTHAKAAASKPPSPFARRAGPAP
jgi:DNA-binding NarL/FixJ family response regulator